VFLNFLDAAEGLCNEISLERVHFGSIGGRVTGGDGESVDEFEDEESGECTTKVADAVRRLV
jgi:hypothetical protein